MAREKKAGILFLIGLAFCLVFTGFISGYEIIVDDGDAGFYTGGAWAGGAGVCGYNGDYLYETDALLNSTARWNLSITIAGNYSVYAHYCVHSARPAAVPFTIRHSTGLSFATIDETKNASGNSSGDFTASGWNFLGTYNFNLTATTPNQFVRLNTTSAGDTCADAVRLVLVANPPTIDFTIPTQTSGIINSGSIKVNVSSGSAYLANMTINLYNSLNLLVNSNFSTLTNLFTEFFLADGIYSFNATMRDLADNINNTETRTVTIDTSNPNIAITSPVNNSQRITNNFNVLHTVSDLTINSCWWTVNGGVSNPLVCGTNITTPIWNQGTSVVVVYANDSFNNLNFSIVSFTVDSIKPEIRIISPANNSLFNITNMTVDYLANDTNMQSCWWTNNSGLNNQTINCSQNITGQIWNEGMNTVRVSASDSFGNRNSSTVSFTIDTIPPYLGFLSPILMWYNNNTININITNSSDAVSIWWSNGSDNIYTAPVDSWFADGVHTIFAYANDSFGNINLTNVTFFVDTSAPILINRSISNCYYTGNNVTADFIVNEANLETVLIEATFEGTWKNYSATCVNLSSAMDFYSCAYTVSSTFLNSPIVNGTFNWRIFANDTSGRINETGIFDFGTALGITPANPDGINDWYVTEPVFTLTNSESFGMFYEWNGINAVDYLGSFGLENDSMSPPERAGAMILGYRANLSCGLESWKSRNLKIDLTSPIIESTSPVNNSLLTCNYRPTISSTVSDVYPGNSNIDPNSLTMTLDGVDVTAGMTKTAFGTYKFRTNYIPPADLSIGNHVVVIAGFDNAGNAFSGTWNFNIAAGTGFTSGVNSPVDGASYGSTYMTFNITSDTIVGQMKVTDNSYPTSLPRTLCRNCSSFYQRIYFANGWHNVTVNVADSCGVSQDTNMLFLVDSLAPRILSTYPPRNTYTNGSKFYIKYTEANLVNLTLFVNGIEIATGCNESGTLKTCTLSPDLSAFNGQYINYYFNITDPVRTIKSATIRVFVDTSVPTLNITSPVNNFTYGNAIYFQRIPFNITMNDDATAVSLRYYDSNVAFPKWTYLCFRCTQYGNSIPRTVYFREPGKWHNVTFAVQDQAGNTEFVQKTLFVG